MSLTDFLASHPQPRHHHPLKSTISIKSGQLMPNLRPNCTSTLSIIGSDSPLPSISSIHSPTQPLIPHSPPPPPPPPSSSSHPQNLTNLPNLPRRTSRLRSITGLSINSSSSSSSSLSSQPHHKPQSSSASSKFLPFLRTRAAARRLSDGSLTDLSPPTIDSDLDLGFQIEQVSSETLHQVIEPPVLHTHLFKPSHHPSIEPHQPSQHSQSAPMHFFRSDSHSSSSSSSFHLRLLGSRLTNKSHHTTSQSSSKWVPSLLSYLLQPFISNHFPFSQLNIHSQSSLGVDISLLMLILRPHAPQERRHLPFRRKGSLSSNGDIPSSAEPSTKFIEPEQIESISVGSFHLNS